jgi:putative NADH-flavin reductase
VRVVVFGAAGAIGRRIVEEAVERGHDVTAVQRNPSTGGNGVPVLLGDVRAPLPVLRALPTQDAVISAVGAPDPGLYRDAAHALVAALRTLRGRVPRMLVVGGAGSLQVEPGRRLLDTPGFPAEFRDEALGQADALAFLRTVSDVRWTYVSPAAHLTAGARTGRFRTGGDELLTDDRGHSEITIADFAVALLEELEQPRAVGRRMTAAY